MTPSDPRPAPDPQVLDLGVIDGLRELGGADDPQLLDELIELFLEDAPARLSELERALDEHDLEGVRRTAHTLKSSSANMGAVSFSRVCKDLEAAARDDHAGLRERQADCRQTYSEFEAALRALRG